MLKALTVFLLCTFVPSMVLPNFVWAQAPCTFDKEKPSIENARYNFKITNYECAEKELEALLALDTIDTETRADAHVLMAAVYYAKLRNDDEKRKRVMEQFVAAFEAFRQWRGELDIKSPEFTEIMEEARTKVEQEEAEAAAVQLPEEPAEQPAMAAVEKESKPWYKKWYVWGIGAAVVGAAVAVAAGGGGDDGGGGDEGPLPGFPDPPTK
jgi:hypothetical protein